MQQPSPTESSGVPAQPRRIIRGAALFLSLILCIAAGETVVRVADSLAVGGNTIALSSDLRVPSISRHHGLKPLTREMREAWGDATVEYCTNSFGMRSATVKKLPLRNPAASRILFLGDSFVEGVGVPYDKTMVAQVEKLLNSGTEKSAVETLNAGVQSYSPVLEYIALAEYMGKGLAVDAVVLCIDISDPQDALVYNQYLHEQGVSLRSTAEEAEAQFHARPFVFLYTHSAMFRMAWRFYNPPEKNSGSWWRDDYYRDRAVWAYDETLIERWGREGLSRCLNNVGRIAALCKARQLPLLCVIYPWPLHLEEGRGPCLFEREIGEYCRKNELPLLNLYPVFRALPKTDAEALYIDGDVHWNSAGHRFVAERIAAKLTVSGIIPAESAAASGKPGMK